MSIPIANIYYILCYAWRHVDQRDAVSVTELKDVAYIQDLLGKVLAEIAIRLLRRGIDRNYKGIKDDLLGVRGKLAISDTVKRALRIRGRIACEYEELSHDIIHNQILKSTLRNLMKINSLSKHVRERVRIAFRQFEGVSEIRISKQSFQQIQLDRNRRAYLFLMSICQLVHENLIVDDQTGSARFPDFHNLNNMPRIFEDFVTAFYGREQDLFSVNKSGKEIKWQNSSGATQFDEEKIPTMYADVILDGTGRRIILDAKYSKKAFGGRGGTPKLKSSDLYQLLTYLQNREAQIPSEAQHEGILLYPVVETPVHADVELMGFRIQARGINLNQPWQNIHNDMLALLS